MPNSSKQALEALLDGSGITINGDSPWDIHVHDERLYDRVLAGGSLAAGESYMAGWWDVSALDEFFCRVIRQGIDEKLNHLDIKLIWNFLKVKLTNPQKSRAFDIGKTHYDLGNDLYQSMLDSRMAYSCGYWENASSLDEAQEAKLELICRKIGLERGMAVLDIGCGWGSFAKYAAENYGVKVVGVTVSTEQLLLGRKLCEGLDVELRYQDYRDVKEKFDRVVSVGMFEHVGYKNYSTYMKTVKSCLADDGLFLLHTIGYNRTYHHLDAWSNKYIFPNGMLPSASRLAKSTEGIFVIEDWHNFGADYDKTLMAWDKNFRQNWDNIKHNYDGRFYRMWRYYLNSCAGSFRARDIQLWQIVISPKGVEGGYNSIR